MTSRTPAFSSAAIWSFGSTVFDRILRFGTFVLVARLVQPQQLGAVVLSLLILETLQTLFDTGIPTALLRLDNPARTELDTAFTITMAASLAAAALMFIAAPLTAALTGVRGIESMLRTMAVVPLINGAASIQLMQIKRELKFRALALRSVVSGLLAGLAALGLALEGYGAWALVGRTLVLAVSGTLFASYMTEYRPRLGLDLGATREVWSSGLKLWASALMNQVNARAFDALAVFALGVASLASFRVAGQTVLLLSELTVGPMLAVGFPLLSRYRGDPTAFGVAAEHLARSCALLIFPAFAGLCATAHLFLPIVFGDRWSVAAALTPFMCLVAPALYWQVIASAALFASGQTGRLVRLSMIDLLMTVAFGVIGANFGLMGLATAGALKVYAVVPFSWRYLQHHTGLDPRTLLVPALPSLGASLFMAAVILWLRTAIDASDIHIRLPISVGIGVAAFALALPLLARLLKQPDPIASLRLQNAG